VSVCLSVCVSVCLSYLQDPTMHNLTQLAPHLAEHYVCGSQISVHDTFLAVDVIQGQADSDEHLRA